MTLDGAKVALAVAAAAKLSGAARLSDPSSEVACAVIMATSASDDVLAWPHGQTMNCRFIATRPRIDRCDVG